MKKRKKMKAQARAPQTRGDNVERAVAPPPAQMEVMPMRQQPSLGYIMPNTGNFAVVQNGMPLGLPQYSSVDEYGRIYTPILSYAPQPNNAPVPVATPAKIVQLAPIVSPVAFVPYSTQNQELYQFDEDDN